MIDFPNSSKQHKDEVPLIGGICVFIGMIVSVIYMNELNPRINIILTFSFIISLLGFWYDIKGLKPRKKLIIQLIIANRDHIHPFKKVYNLFYW